MDWVPKAKNPNVPNRASGRGSTDAAASATPAARARSLATPVRRAASCAPGRLRIVGGAWKRTPIAVANIPGLRPTPDRVRESLFNWIAFLRPDTSTLRGLDLFAGTGALGFELASRGAQRVLLVEHDARLVAALVALKERLHAQQIEIRTGDAFQVAAQLGPASFDVVFLDPPFEGGLLEPALQRVRPLLAEHGLVYVESPVPVSVDQASRVRLRIVRQGRAGRVCFHLLRADGS